MTDTDCQIRIEGAAADIFFPPASAWGIQTNISRIDAGQMKRTINGTLIDLTREEMRKFVISLSSSGLNLPDLSGMFRGMRCTIAPPVWWTKEIPAGASSVTLARPCVSAMRFDADMVQLSDPIITPNTQIVTFLASDNRTFIKYQPVFETRITNISDSHEEWEASATWSIEAEEV